MGFIEGPAFTISSLFGVNIFYVISAGLAAYCMNPNDGVAFVCDRFALLNIINNFYTRYECRY